MKRTNEFGLTGDQAEGRVGDGPESDVSTTGSKPEEKPQEEPKPIEEKKNE